MAQITRISNSRPVDPINAYSGSLITTDGAQVVGDTHPLDIGQFGSCFCDGRVDYRYLSRLCRDGLIKAGVETTADAMTSEWITVKSTGSSDAEKEAAGRKVTEIEQWLTDNNIQKIFNEAARNIGYFGGCLVFIDTGLGDNRPALEAPMVSGSKDFIKGFKVIEPCFATADGFDMANPLREDFFRNQFWLLQGSVKVHHSHFLYFSSGDTPALMRPQYNFFGVPIAEVALPFVANFTDAREASARLLLKLSRLIFKTDLSGVLTTGGDTQALDQRMKFAVDHWSNDDVLIIDNMNEDFINVQTNIAGVTDVVRQTLEQVAAIFRMTVVKLLGITPSGLNATGEIDERNWQEHVGSMQERQLNDPLERLLDLVQVHLYGASDKTISFEWNPLGEVDARTEAETSAINTQTIGTAIAEGVVSKGEGRLSLQKTVPMFANIDPDEIPETPSAFGGSPLFPDYADTEGAEEPLTPLEAAETEEGLTPQESSFNGAQISSMVSIVKEVAQGMIPRESGLAMLQAAFPVDEEGAKGILSNAGSGFVPATSDPETAVPSQTGTPTEPSSLTDV